MQNQLSCLMHGMCMEAGKSNKCVLIFLPSVCSKDRTLNMTTDCTSKRAQLLGFACFRSFFLACLCGFFYWVQTFGVVILSFAWPTESEVNCAVRLLGSIHVCFFPVCPSPSTWVSGPSATAFLLFCFRFLLRQAMGSALNYIMN